MNSDYSTYDAALAPHAALGTDMDNGFINHGPMAIEALCALGYPGAAAKRASAYIESVCPRPPAQVAIREDDWREALGVVERYTDWRTYFTAQTEAGSWHAVMNAWAGRLAPGYSGAAGHGVIRVAHAVRALQVDQSPAKVQEFADAMALWASTYTELPVAPQVLQTRLKAAEALKAVPLVPENIRDNAGDITDALAVLARVPEFANAADAVDVEGDVLETMLDMAEVFAGVFRANATTPLYGVVFTHAITGVAAAHVLQSHVSDADARLSLKQAWRFGAALYAVYAMRPPERSAVSTKLTTQGIVEKAVAHGDAHVVKLTEAAVRFNALRPSPSLLEYAGRLTGLLDSEASD